MRIPDDLLYLALARKQTTLRAAIWGSYAHGNRSRAPDYRPNLGAGRFREFARSLRD